MNKSTINELSAQTNADSNSTAQNQQVSQPNANTNVVGSLFGQREIKFRAWDGEKMHEGVIPWHWDFVISLSWHRCEESTGSGILGSGGKTAEMLVPAIRYEKIMQYTGLKDKNGTEIYEGDIVNHAGWVDFVKFGENGSCFSFVTKSGETDLSVITEAASRYTEIIGNIFENPELL